MTEVRPDREPEAEQAWRRRGLGVGAIRLGDIIKALTTIAGVRPCKACERRAESLNHLFSSRSRRKD